MSALVNEVNAENFEAEVLKSADLVLIDFWAEWCGPCKRIAPTVESIAEKYQGKAKVFKMNVDENQGTPMRYNIRGIPTMLLFKDGQPVAQKVGAAPRSQIQQWLESNLSASSSTAA